MRVPKVSERMKEAPAQALRGVFAGIGQLLLMTDKMRNKAPAGVQRVRTPEGPATPAKVTASEPASQREQTAEPTQAPAAPASMASKPAPGRDFDKTGNVRLIREGGATAARPDSFATQSKLEAPAAGPEPDAPAAQSMPQVSAPLPNYGELSVASLRARLRSLDVSQVRELLDYERTHAGRPDVISMFERRIVKLEAGA